MTADPWAEPRKVFFISPIGEDSSDVRKQADQVLKHVVRKALPSSTFTVERADEDRHPGAITPRIIQKIVEAELILADLSGLNANVFYELAVAHGFQKPVVHMQRSDERPPFDVKDMRIVRYLLTDLDKVEAAITELAAVVKAAFDSPTTIETPLSAAGKFLSLEQSTDPQAEVAERLSAIEHAISGDAPRSRLRTFDDSDAIVQWVEEQVTLGRVERENLAGLLTSETSKWYDAWVQSLYAKLPKAQSDPWGDPSPKVAPDPWSAGSSDEPPF